MAAASPTLERLIAAFARPMDVLGDCGVDTVAGRRSSGAPATDLRRDRHESHAPCGGCRARRAGCGRRGCADQTLRIGLAEDPDVLDPTLARTFVGRIVFAALCDKLFDIDEKLNIVPQLALSLRDGRRTARR